MKPRNTQLPGGRRVLALLALGTATAVLAVAGWLVRANLQHYRAERGAATATESRLSAARALMPEVERRERYAAQVAETVTQAQQLGFDPATWAERRIVRSGTSISRREANDLLRQLGGGGHDGLFAADSFDLSVLSRDAGLFSVPSADDKGVTLSMNGVLYFPLAAGDAR